MYFRIDWRKVARYVKQIFQDGKVSFVAANPFCQAGNLFSERVLVQKIAPVVWWRKVDI